MNPQICPKCGEENPAEAILCWACYTPLPGVNPHPIRVNNEEPEFTFPQIGWWLGKADAVLPILIAVGLISSGWWRGKTRFAVLGTGLGVWLGAHFQQKRNEAERAKRDLDHRDEKSPIIRIADTILLYGVKDRATKIRISRLAHAVKVEYQLEGQWRDQMGIPTFVWQPLKNELEVRAGMGNIEFSQDGQNAHFGLRVLIEPPQHEITLTLLENQ